MCDRTSLPIHRGYLITVNHLIQLVFRLVLHAANVLHGQPVPLVHLADELSHGAGEHLDLLGANDVLDDGLQAEVLEGVVRVSAPLAKDIGS